MASACVLIQCPITGMYLGVSRKDDPNAWGLPGGKVEEGQTEEDAARTELEQETGVVLYKTWGYCCELKEVFRRDGGVTFEADIAFIRCVGKLAPGETGRVAWVTREQLENGPFGDYNKALFRKLDGNE